MLPPQGDWSSSLRFPGPGQVVLVAGGGTGHAFGEALVWIAGDRARRLSITAPRRARWLSPRAIIVERSGPPARRELVEVRPHDDAQRLVSAGGFTAPEPSPGGQFLALGHVVDPGGVRLEIRRWTDAEGLKLIQAHSPQDLPLLEPSVVWHPDGLRLAVGIRSNESGRAVPRVAVLDMMGRCITPLADGPAARAADPRGVVPAFWARGGLFAISDRGLVVCETGRQDFEVVYGVPTGRRVTGAEPCGADRALLLVANGTDPQCRASEIRRIDLSTGECRVALALPTGAFVSGIAWSKLPE